ncbi:MAG: Ig-like domain-containing protein, partial [Lachnospiraceae bacterium]|nr:Ig-like domain-containing protein [Lachnospiraceae bacterium]
NKQNDVPNTPKDLYVGKGEKTVSDVGLPANWQWSSKDAKKTIGENTGDTITATAEYVGEDKANYQNITKVILITRADCYHSAIQYRDAKKATCTEPGYQGDKYCKVCGKFVGNGESTSPLGHNYISSITTRPTVSTLGVRTYRCTRCGKTIEEKFLSTSDNAAGNIYLRPALYENVKTASVTLSDADIDTAIESAPGKTITVNVSPMSGGTSMAADKVNITLTKEVQSKLVSNGITSTVLHTPQAEISFSLSALTDIQSQAGGDATVTMQDVTGEEKRPRYNFTVYKNDGETAITDFTTTGITVKIPYTRQSVNSDGEVVTGGTLEDTSGILGIYVDSSGNAEYVTGSYFDSNTGNVVIPTNHLSIYGVGYKVGSSNTVSSSKVVRARADASKKYVKIKITKVSGATKYVIYGAQTGKTTKKLKTITGTSAKITGLKAKTSYKYYVKAYKGSTLLGKSKICYIYTTGGKYGNQKNVTVTPTTLSLAAGGSESLKVTYKKSGKLKKFTSYVRYATSNSAVATVSSSGEVKGLTAGSCYIYIYTMNGYQKSVKVTVS